MRNVNKFMNRWQKIFTYKKTKRLTQMVACGG